MAISLAVTRAQRRWLGPALLAVAVYLTAGIGFGTLAGHATSHRGVVFWRLAAWVASAIAFATQIGYELLRLRASTRAVAWHAAAAAGVGALGLAVAANVHAVAVSSWSPRHAIALVVWTAVTAVPAFAVALVTAAALSRFRPVE